MVKVEKYSNPFKVSCRKTDFETIMETLKRIRGDEKILFRCFNRSEYVQIKKQLPLWARRKVNFTWMSFK